MHSNRMTALWARTALAWFVITVCMGMFMGITQQFHYAPSHAHMGVLGWLSSAVISYLHTIARPFPPKAIGPRLHWAAHNIGVAIMTASLFLMHHIEAAAGFIGLGAMMIVISVIWLAVMMWGRVGAVEASSD